MRWCVATGERASDNARGTVFDVTQSTAMTDTEGVLCPAEALMFDTAGVVEAVGRPLTRGSASGGASPATPSRTASSASRPGS